MPQTTTKEDKKSAKEAAKKAQEAQKEAKEEVRKAAELEKVAKEKKAKKAELAKQKEKNQMDGASLFSGSTTMPATQKKSETTVGDPIKPITSNDRHRHQHQHQTTKSP